MTFDDRYQWFDFELDESTDAVPDKFVLTIADSDGEEVAVMIHRASEQYPINGALANQKREWAQQIVAAMNAQNVELSYLKGAD